MKNTKTILITLGIVVAVALMGVFICQGSRNTAISYEEQIKTAKSDIKVQEKRRADLIPNLVDCVKQYDKHEYQTLMDVVKARGTSSDESVEEIQTMISAVAEAYPELKSSDNYKELMNELSTTENMIANYRGNYNTWVGDYNKYIQSFPHNIFLSITGYQVEKYERLDFDVSEDAPTNLFD